MDNILGYIKKNNKELLRPLTLYFLCVNYTSYCLSVLLVNIDDASKFPIGAPVAQWVKCWPADLTNLSSSPARGKFFSTINRVPLHAAFNYQPLIIMI